MWWREGFFWATFTASSSDFRAEVETGTLFPLRIKSYFQLRNDTLLYRIVVYTRLFILMEKSSLHGLIWYYTIIYIFNFPFEMDKYCNFHYCFLKKLSLYVLIWYYMLIWNWKIVSLHAYSMVHGYSTEQSRLIGSI